MRLDLDLQRLFAYEFWADREVLAALRLAGDNAPPRALAVMNHIVAAAELWLARLTSEKVKIVVWPNLSIDEMSDRIARLDTAWGTWIDGATAASLDQQVAYVNSLGETWTSPARDIVAHIPLHAAYHRGQIAILLGQSQQKPAYTDFIHASRQHKI